MINRLGLLLLALSLLLVLQNAASVSASNCDLKILLPEATDKKVASSAFVLSGSALKEESTASTTAPKTASDKAQAHATLPSDDFGAIIAGWMGFGGSKVYDGFISQSPEINRWSLWNRPRALLLMHVEGVSPDMLPAESTMASLLKSADLKVDFAADTHKRFAADRTAQFLRDSSSGFHFSEILESVAPHSLIFENTGFNAMSASILGSQALGNKKTSHSKFAEIQNAIRSNLGSSRLFEVLKNHGLNPIAKNGQIHATKRNSRSETADLSFDLHHENNQDLLAELEYSLEMLHQIETKFAAESARDSSPDLFVFQISSLQKIAQQYKNDREKLGFAHIAVDSVVTQVAQTISKIYSHDVLSIIHISGIDDAHNSAGFDSTPLRALIGKGIDPQYKFEPTFPCVNFRQSINAQQKTRLCKRIQKAGNLQDIHIDCPEYVGNTPLFTKSLEAIKAAKNETKPESEDIVMYHITLWMGVALVLGSILVLSSMLFMPLRYDSLLHFSPTSRIRVD